MSTSFVQHFVEAAPYVVRMRDRHYVLWIDPALPAAALPELAEEVAILRVLGARLTLIVGQGVDDETAPLPKTQADLVHAKNAQQQWHWMNLLSRGWVGVPDRKFRVAAVSGNVVTGRRVGVLDGVDRGHAGRVRAVDTERIKALLDAENVILQTGSVPGMTGLFLVVSTLSMAVRYAVATRAEKLIFVSSSMPEAQYPGEWRRDQLDAAVAAQPDSLRPLLTAMSQGIEKGLERIHLVDGMAHGSLLSELLSRRGSGLLVGQTQAAEVLPAQADEISELVALISRFEPEGNLAPRSRALIEGLIDHFHVLKIDGRIVGCGAVRRLQDSSACLIESVAIHQDFQGQRLGASLVKALLVQAQKSNVDDVYVLTTGAEEWFKGFGFHLCKNEEVPEEIGAVVDPSRNSMVLKKKLLESERLPD